MRFSPEGRPERRYSTARCRDFELAADIEEAENPECQHFPPLVLNRHWPHAASWVKSLMTSPRPLKGWTTMHRPEPEQMPRARI